MSAFPASRRWKGLVVISAEWLLPVYGPAELEELGAHVDFVGAPQTSASLRANLPLLRDVEVLFTGWGSPVMDEALLTAAPRLRAIFHAGGSIRYFTTEAFWVRGIVVTTAAGANAVAVVDYTLATILFSLRHGWYYERGAQRTGAFPVRRALALHAPPVVGLVSLGMVGSQVAERLRSFELTLLAYDPFVSEGAAAGRGISLVTLEALFSRSDVVSVHAPSLQETEGLITGAHLAAMKENATFINTARGAVVREAELVNVLARRGDLTAVLDVTAPEPPPPGSPLYDLANVILTPHIAATQGYECRRLSRCMIDEFQRWRHGEPLRFAVTRAESTHRA
ncbi:MAG: glycerate dehydrogenase [Verrucomicrobia bacterium]|nr:glycerate dehydrogenase [Verrucomicrobiota bacterium]